MIRRSVVVALVLVLAVAAGAWWWSRPESQLEPLVDVPLPVAAEPSDEVARTALDAAPCTASGRVVRASDGTGVADAFVFLQQPRITSAPPPIVRRTDASGQWSADDLRPGRWIVSASAPGLAPNLSRNVVLQPGKEHTGIELALSDALAEITGVVTDPTGAPIADARVEVSRAVERSSGASGIFGTLTDRDGRYRLGAKFDGYYARVVHRDHVSAAARVVVTSAGVRTRDFVLAPGAVVRGRVLARDDGRPIPDAIVRRQMLLGSVMGSTQTTDHEDHAIAGPDGSFELRGLPAGTADLVASGPGATSVEPTSVPLGVAETVEDVELLVDVGYTVAGYVVASDDDTVAIAGATVSIVDFTDLGGGRMSDPTGDDGAFVVHGVRPGHYTVMVFGQDAVPSMKQQLEVTPADMQDVLVRATRGRRVRGRIEPGGSAIVRLAVALRPTATDNPMQTMDRLMSTFGSVDTETDGTFEIGPLIPGTYVVQATGPQLRGELETVLGERDDSELVVPMVPGMTVSGTVRDSDGHAVPGALVSLALVEQRRVLSLAETIGAAPHSAVADADGRFVIGGLARGKYSYDVDDDLGMRLPWRDGDGDPLGERTLALDRDRELALVVAPAQTFRGRVVDHDGRPIAGAWVRAWPDVDVSELQLGATADAPFAGKPSEAVRASLRRQTSQLFAAPPVLTDDDGRFAVPGLRRDRWSLSAHAGRGQLHGELAARTPSDDVTLVVEPLATLRIVLADEATGGTIRVLLEGSETRTRWFRPARELVVERMPPGKWQVTIDAPAGLAKGELVLVGGESGELRLALAPWATVRGRVVDVRTGAPQGGLYPIVASPTATLGDLMARASAMVGAMSGDAAHHLDADGRFTLEHLPAGTLDVSFLATPELDTVATLHLDDLKAGEVRDVGNVEGLALASAPKEARGTLGIDTKIEQPALLVERVVRRSPAAKAGVRPGDRIVAIDDVEVARVGARAARRAFSDSRVRRGEQHRVRLDRDGTTIDVELTAIAAPREEP